MNVDGQTFAITLSVVANLTSFGAILYSRHCRKKIDTLIRQMRDGTAS